MWAYIIYIMYIVYVIDIIGASEYNEDIKGDDWYDDIECDRGKKRVEQCTR